MKPTRRKSVLEKIARKNLADTAKLKTQLVEQQNHLIEIQDLIVRVRDLQENAQESQFVSPTELRAARWYSLKLSEQFTILNNRVEFIESEINNLRSMSRTQSLKNTKLDKLIAEAKNMIRIERDREQDKKASFVYGVKA
ncbi:hypothetical protein N9E48_04540 [Paracoccaceae bacterium]|jgi:hypothetical protein|nr:hypothetical protein [Paracoccaceae bacterium]